jgi:NDP-sugar pyrophosphorylase family protein
MSHHKPIRHALIMAAGRGNRMRPLTDIVPKAMVPFRGDTLVGNSLKMLHSHVAHIHVTVGYKSAMLSKYLMEIDVDSILNTDGHSNSWWIYNTLLCFVDEPVLVLTCDNITTLDIELITKEYYRTGALAGMIVPVQPIPKIEGDFIEHENDLVISLQRVKPTDRYCSGIQVINPAKVVTLTEDRDSFYTVWNQLIAKRQLSTSCLYPYPWFSVDTLEQLANVPQQDVNLAV